MNYSRGNTILFFFGKFKIVVRTTILIASQWDIIFSPSFLPDINSMSVRVVPRSSLYPDNAGIIWEGSIAQWWPCRWKWMLWILILALLGISCVILGKCVSLRIFTWKRMRTILLFSLFSEIKLFGPLPSCYHDYILSKYL